MVSAKPRVDCGVDVNVLPGAGGFVCMVAANVVALLLNESKEAGPVDVEPAVGVAPR